MSMPSTNRLMWISKAFFVAIVLALTGCASDIMKNYIGQPVESVILDYGPPTAAPYGPARGGDGGLEPSRCRDRTAAAAGGVTWHGHRCDS